MPHPVSKAPIPQCLDLRFYFPLITEQSLTGLLRESKASELNVSHNHLTHEQIRIIVASVKASNIVSSLIAVVAKIDASSGEILFQILEEYKYLKTLYLQGNDIGLKGAKSLAKYLPEAIALENLNLSNNNINLEGGVKILQALCKLPNLKILDLGGNDLTAGVAESIALLLGQDSTLEELYLLSANLSLGGTKVLQALRSNSTLSKLNLAHNNLDDDAGEVLVEVLKTNGVLSSLSIRDNKFSANVLKKIAEALEVNNSLSVLFIGGRGNEFDSSAFKALGKAIENNKTLKYLSLNGATVKENGPELALSLRKSTLENIDLCFTEIEDQAATILASLLLLEGSKLRFFIRDNFISPELREIIDILTSPEVKHPDYGLFNFLFSNKKSQKFQKEKAREKLKGLIKKLPCDLLKKLQEDLPADHIEIDCSDECPFMEYHPLLPPTHTLGEKAYSTFMEGATE